MKKIGLFVLLFLLILPSVLAIDVEVSKSSSKDVLIAELGQPAIFNLNMTNKESSGEFSIYNLLGFVTEPKKILLTKDQPKNLELIIYPRDNFDYRGFYTLEYFIKGGSGETQKEELTLKVINLKDAFEIGSGELLPETNSLEVFIHNQVNFDFEKVEIKFKSAFFEFEEDFSLGAFEKKTFSVNLNKEDFKKLMAGFYTLNGEVTVEGKKADVEGIIKFVEKDILETTKKDYGLIINTQIIEKKNEGNVIVESETIIKKNILSRLFTSLSPEPSIVERSGFAVYYTWNEKVNPGETLQITVRTNWLLPLLIIFFIIIIVFFTKQYSKTNLSLRKRVSFVRAKGGEFALKVTIFVNAKSHVERVSVVDRLPPMVKIYEKFGNERPSRINEKTRRIEWELNDLDVGETRVLSYVIYSKVGVMGKFALPGATALYERNGEIHETESNKAFFVTEQKGKDAEEY